MEYGTDAPAAHRPRTYAPVPARRARRTNTLVPIASPTDKVTGGTLMISSAERPQAPWALSLLPPFTAIAHRILALASQERVSAQEVGPLIRLDPSFSAEVLGFANSALFGARCRVTRLTQAVALLGMNRLKSMATFVAVNKMVRSSVRSLALRKVWVHSV